MQDNAGIENVAVEKKWRHRKHCCISVKSQCFVLHNKDKSESTTQCARNLLQATS